MSSIAEEYAGQLEVNVVPASETAQRQDEILEFGFTAKKHGLVGFGPDGEVLVKLPGHNIDDADYEALVKTLLASR